MKREDEDQYTTTHITCLRFTVGCEPRPGFVAPGRCPRPWPPEGKMDCMTYCSKAKRWSRSLDGVLFFPVKERQLRSQRGMVGGLFTVTILYPAPESRGQLDNLVPNTNCST